MGFLGQMIGNKVSGADKAPKEAAQIESQANYAAIDENRRQYDLTRADQLAQYQQARTDQAPWLDAGRNALTRLQDPNAFAASPDYQFRLDQGTKNIGNSFAARGGALGGNALRALTQFSSNLASGEYGDWWNRQANLAGVGQSAANNVTSAGQNMVNALTGAGQNTAANIGNYMQNAGSARASGVLGSAAVRQNAINYGREDAANWFGRMYGGGGFYGG